MTGGHRSVPTGAGQVAAPDPALIRDRLGAQLLSGPRPPWTDPVVERLLAVQAQDPRAARLAFRSRTTVEDAATVDEALGARRAAVVTWLNRGTLHLVATEDYWWLHPLTTPQLRTAHDRRLRREHLGPRAVDRGVAVIVETLRAQGPRSRRELGAVLEASGVHTQGEALGHLLVEASLRGQLVRGPDREGRPAYVEVADWLGPAPDPLEPAAGRARLCRRYLAGHGPASPRDLAKWAGIPLAAARAGIESIRGELVVDGDLVDLVDREVPVGMPPPRLLGAFDPVLHGWVDREPIIGPYGQVVTTNGIFRPIALVEGRVVGSWTLAQGQVRLTVFEPVAPTILEALAEEALAVLRFLGMPETPLQLADGAGR
jgi:Winged helix DNA-binding domain